MYHLISCSFTDSFPLTHLILTGLFALTYGVRYLTGRQCVFIGAILAVLSFVLSSLAKNGLILFVSYGFLLGTSIRYKRANHGL